MANVFDLTGTLTLEDEFSSAMTLVAQRVQQGVRQIEGSFATVALGVTAVVTTVAGLAASIVGLGVRGSELNDLDAGFQRLAGSIENADRIMAEMNKGVADTVDSTKLLEFANRALSNGAIKTAEDFGTVTQAARVLSRQGFGPIEGLLGTINSAMTTGRVRSLQLMTGVIDLKSAEEKYAKSLGVTAKELSASGKLHAAQIAILERLNQKVGEAGTLQKSFAERMTSARLAIGNWFDDLAKATAASPKVNAALDAIGNALVKNFGGTAQSALEVIVSWIEKFADAAAHYGPIVIDWIRDAIDGIKAMWTWVKEAWAIVPDWFKNIAKEAALAGGAIYLTHQALSSLGGASGGGFGIPELATTISGARDAFAVLASAIPAATLALRNFGLMWLFVFRTGGLMAVVSELGIAFTGLGATILAFAATPIGIAAIFTVIAAAFWEVGKAIWNFGDIWKQGGGTLWGFLTLRDDDNFVRRWLGLSKAINETADAVDRLQHMKPIMGFADPQEARESGRRPTSAFGLDRSGDIATGVTKTLSDIEKATKASIERTQRMWDSYSSAFEKRTLSEGEFRLGEIERTTAAEMRVLNETKMGADQYLRERYAIYANYREKVIALEEEMLNKAMDAFQKTIDAARDMARDAHNEIAKGLSYLNAATAKGPLQSSNPFLNVSQLGGLPAVGSSGVGTVPNIGMLMPASAGLKQGQSVGSAFTTGFRDSLRDLPNTILRAIEGGGSIASAIGSSIGASIGGSIANNLSSRISKAFTGLGGEMLKGLTDMIPVIGSLVGPLIERLGAKLKDLFGGPSEMEMAGREAAAAFQNSFGNLENMVNSLGAAYLTVGKTLDQARIDAKKLLDATREGPEAVNAIIKELQAALDAAKEIDAAISGLGIKSTVDLQHLADVARQAYEKVAKGAEIGQYTAEDVTKAYRAFQQALADMGDEAAKAWLKIHGGAQESMADLADKAGYKTLEQLQETANKATELYEYMKTSGKFGADAIADAFERARDAQMDALGISKKIRDEMKSLQDAIAIEAPEPEMGAIEKAQRERLAELEKQTQAMADVGAAGEAAAEATNTGFHNTSQDIRDGWVITTDGMEREMKQTSEAIDTSLTGSADHMQREFVTKADAAFAYIQDKFGNPITVKVVFDLQNMPNPTVPQGSRPIVGPSIFDTQISGFEETEPTVVRSGPVTVQNIIGGRIVKDVVFDELEAAPTDRDVRILEGLRR